MSNKIHCAACEFSRPDRKASTAGWTAYACTNPESEYFGSLLNVTVDGKKQDRITWTGCESMRKKVGK